MLKKALREEMRKLNDEWFQRKAEDAEEYAQEKNLGKFYETLNAEYGPEYNNLHPVRAECGEPISFLKTSKIDELNTSMSYLTNQKRLILISFIK